MAPTRRRAASGPLMNTVWHVPGERRAWFVGDNHALRSSGTCHTPPRRRVVLNFRRDSRPRPHGPWTSVLRTIPLFRANGKRAFRWNTGAHSRAVGEGTHGAQTDHTSRVLVGVYENAPGGCPSRLECRWKAGAPSERPHFLVISRKFPNPSHSPNSHIFSSSRLTTKSRRLSLAF